MLDAGKKISVKIKPTIGAQIHAILIIISIVTLQENMLKIFLSTNYLFFCLLQLICNLIYIKTKPKKPLQYKQYAKTTIYQ